MSTEEQELIRALMLEDYADSAEDQTGDLRVPILVVEDGDDDYELLLAALGGIPVVPTRARNMREALAAVTNLNFSCVLLDLSLPDSHGLATIKSMTAKHDAVIVLTGQGDELTLAAIRAGADAYLRKGATPIEVRRAVMSAIARRQARLQARRAPRPS